MTIRTRTVLTLAAVAMAILGLATASANAGVISYVQITNDADSGISADKIYTHKLDFGQGTPGALINGVQFDAYNNAANGTLNFNREVFSGLLSDHPGNGNHNVSGSLVDLMTDMYYNGNNAIGGTRTWTLSGLTAGQTYSTRIYTRMWGATDSRLATFVFDPDGAGPVSDSPGKISQDNATSVGFANGNDAYYINYQFTAVAGEDLVITLTQDNYNYSWHLYGLTNEISGPVTKAYGPSPEDGTLLEATWATLGWSAGDYAVSHDLYLSDNFDDVNSGSEAAFLSSKAVDDTMQIVGFFGFPYPDGLVPGTTYYWRVDEVNDSEPNSPWKGDVWSFSIPPRSAYAPSPSDGGQYVATDVTLNWTAGFEAKLHYVQFGDNFDDVNNAAVGAGTGGTTPSFSPGTLEVEKTYYWRVDESNPPNPTVKGDVWSFTTLPVIPIEDPSLVGWWTFDEGQGGTALDWSGHENHGAFVGDPQWAAGQDGGALQFGGSGDYVGISFSPELSLNDFTVSAWVNIAARPGTFGILGTRVGSDNTFDVKVMATEIHGDIGDGSAWIDTSIDIESDHMGSNGQPGDLTVDTWYMIAYVIDNAGQQVLLYLDGDLKRTIAISGTPVLMESGQSMRIGHTGTGGEWMNGLIDDVRIYNKALTAEEIQVAMRGDLTRAWNPNPVNSSATYIGEATPLTWSPGENASQHDVYFGIDEDAVAGADTSDTTGVFRGVQTDTSYDPPEGVEWGGGPYYWRIDEIEADGTVNAGTIWKFTVPDYLIVDDIESYNDLPEDDPASNRIYLAWIDGFDNPTTNGAVVGNLDVPLTERDNVHGGSQAMPYGYDNNLKTSEATLTLAKRDWTEQGVTKLSLWFRGDAANAAERMYVALNGNAVVYHEDPAVTQIARWTEWVVDLTAFAGVDLTNVSTITIGFGTKGSPAAGGTGTMYFDDIQLRR
jgi:hypothetical protein